MKTMKKWLVLSFALTLLFALPACSKVHDATHDGTLADAHPSYSNK